MKHWHKFTTRFPSRILVAVLLIAAILFRGGSAEADETIRRSAPPIRSAAEIDYPPFSLVDDSGEPSGFSVELMRAALKAMGRGVTFRTGPWTEVRGWLERGEVQALPLVGRTPEREALFDFTVPYLTLHGAIVVREGETEITDLADLAGRRVAVMKGDNAEEFLRREERGIDIHTTPTFEIALRELSKGRYDAVVVQRLVALRLIQKTGLTDLRVIDHPIEGFQQAFSFAVREGDRNTLALLNEGLAIVIADGAYRHLHAKWFAAMQLPSDRPIVVGGDRNFPPYEFLDENGHPVGYNVDLTRAIARETGLKVEIRLGRWPERKSALKSGKIDVMQGMFYSPGRNLDFDFTPAHTVSHYVAVVRKSEAPAPESVEALAGKHIVVKRGDILHEFALEQGLENQLTGVADQEEALRELVRGRHDCALVSRMTALFLIDKYGWSDLEPGKKPLLAPEYCFAAAKGRKALLAQFSEGLKALENSGEYRRIHDRWLGVYQEKPASLITALRYSALVIIPLLVILMTAFAWSWFLRRQVAEKTRALQESLEYQRAMIACSPVALYTIDLDGNVLSWNTSAEKIFGWRAEEIIGRPLPIIPEQFRREFDSNRKQVLEGGGFFGRELMRLKRDGTLFPVNLSVAPVRNDRGETVGILGAAEDITQRKAFENQLRWNLQRNELLSNTAARLLQSDDPQALVQKICGRVMEFLDCRVFFNFLEDPKKGGLRLNAFAGIPEQEAEKVKWLEHGASVCGCVAQHQPMTCENISNCEDPLTDLVKSYRIRAYCCHPLMVQDRLIGTLSFGRRSQSRFEEEEIDLMASVSNLTAAAINRIETQNRLRESEFRFRSMVENAPEPIFIQTEMRFAYLNPRAIELFGAEDAEPLLGTPVMQRFHPDFHEQIRKRIQTLNEDHKSVKELVEQKYLRLDGSSVWVETTGQPIVYHGKNGGLVFVRDITKRKTAEQERKQLEAQLMQAQKMESVGRLAGGVAHDYNNMLSLIIGYAELALDKTDPDDPLQEDLHEILNAARRSADITRQLLAFARRQTIHPDVIDLNETVEAMLKMLRRLIGEDIELFWRPGTGPMSIFMDPSQLDQLLANLCVNARDAISGVGRLSIETDRVRFDARYCAEHAGFIPGDFVMLAVSDNGCGMDKDTLEKIFEPFFTTKEVGRGTGLGLSTVFGIVKQNKGFIHVYSEPGKGTTFRIYLPPHTGEESLLKAEEAADIPAGQSETVLIVEDETAILKLARTILERRGYTVLTASTPGRAVNLSQAHAAQIDLLITDVVMPEMNGHELAETLQARFPKLKVLFMSGYTANVIADRGVLDAGVNFLQKPFSNRELAAKVHEILKS